MKDSSELFITHVDASTAQNTPAHRDLLYNVRKKHKKINEVVESFRSKVDEMVDKQRAEYVSAYENHIQDVQKELHVLREKVRLIYNDQTKNERTEKLKADLNYYKDKALDLEAANRELRLDMNDLVRQIYSVGTLKHTHLTHRPLVVI
jgi:hypothetical protein